jgi:hypothetical protein
MGKRFLVAVLLVAACGEGRENAPRDLAGFVPNDMATGPDLSGPVGSQEAQYVVSKLSLPTNTASFSYDLDGDGSADNRLGSIMSALSALGMNPQGNADQAVASGQLILLIEQASSDPTQQNAATAAASLLVGKATSAPKFDGTGSFMIDTSQAPADFTGSIAGGTFTSEDPATATTPVDVVLSLPLVPGMAPLPLPVTGAHMTFKRSTSGAITSGQLNGGIKKSDVDSIVLPAIADMMTTQLAISPTIAMFDTNGDGTITATELKSNALISNFVAPDVQLFTNGVFKPNPAKTTKDSLSLGIGIQGAKATF